MMFLRFCTQCSLFIPCALLKPLTLVSVQSLCHIWLFVTPWTAAGQASLSTNSRACSNSCLSGRWCHPAISSSVVPFSSCLQSFPASGSFPVVKVLEFQVRHQCFSECSGLISFRIDWFDLLAVQGTLKSLLQHHSSKASILWHSAFFMVQLSHAYMTTGKNNSFD